jgi:hypothetical protein
MMDTCLQDMRQDASQGEQSGFYLKENPHDPLPHCD